MIPFEEINLELERRVDQALEERISLGLLVPSKPEVEIRIAGPAASATGEKIGVNIFQLRGGNNKLSNVAELVYFSIKGDQTRALSFLLGEGQLEPSDLENPSDEYLQALRELLNRTRSAFRRYADNIPNYLANMDVLNNIRHEVDHVAFHKGHVGQQYAGLFERLNGLFAPGDFLAYVRRIPDGVLRKFLQLQVLCETCAWFFNFVQYGKWEHFRRNPGRVIHQVENRVSLEYVEADIADLLEEVLPISDRLSRRVSPFEFPGIYVDFRLDALKKSAAAVGKAYKEDPTRLKETYSKAETFDSFIRMANGRK